MRLIKMFAILLVIAFALAADCGRAADAGGAPVLVELFTSEGCSSCPPADDLVRQIDSDQPVPGVQIIVLSEHVNYWDHDGWKDPNSSDALTDRQSQYERALGLGSPYTPQIILDGGGELRASNTQQVLNALQKAGSTPKVPVQITSLKTDATSPVIHAHISADGTLQKRNAEVFVAVALDHSESQVQSGENSGKHLTHVAIVREMVKVGKLEKQKTFAQDVQIKLKSPVDPANLRFIAFVQEPSLGKVLGSAMEKPAK